MTWLLIGAASLVAAAVLLVAGVIAWFVFASGGVDIPYQDAHIVRGTRVEADCQSCLVLQPASDGGSAPITVRLTDSTRYDNHQSFPVGGPVTAWVPDTPNADGTWTAIEVSHGDGSSRRGAS